MKVLLVEPEKAPREIEIDKTLEALQGSVGGLIEMVYPFRDRVALICNDEGKNIGLPLNRVLRNESGQPYEIIAGAFLITGLGEEDVSDLPPELMAKYKELFKTPEKFISAPEGIYVVPMEARVETEHMGMEISCTGFEAEEPELETET